MNCMRNLSPAKIKQAAESYSSAEPGRYTALQKQRSSSQIAELFLQWMNYIVNTTKQKRKFWIIMCSSEWRGSPTIDLSIRSALKHNRLHTHRHTNAVMHSINYSKNVWGPCTLFQKTLSDSLIITPSWDSHQRYTHLEWYRAVKPRNHLKNH